MHTIRLKYVDFTRLSLTAVEGRSVLFWLKQNSFETVSKLF